MGVLDNLCREADTALVIWFFLQADHKSAEYRDELLSLGQELSLTPATDLNGCTDAFLDDGHLETDGSRPSCITFRLSGAQPAEALHRLDAAAIQQAAEELREIADHLEHRVLAEAEQNLRRNLLTSTSDKWKDHLQTEVSRVMRQNVTLTDVAREHITVALTLTLVKGVCRQVPQLLRNLFTTTLHYIIHSRAK